MATYQDFHRVIKETIQVDSDPNKRWTPQLVKFINHSNEFYGTFYGKVKFDDGLTASNCSLSNCNLSSCKLYDLSGNELDLNTLFPEIQSIRDLVDRISSEVLVEIRDQCYRVLPSAINKVSSYVDEVSAGISSIIDEKIAKSGGQIYQDLSAISSLLQEEIDDEISDRIEADSILQSQITDISAKIKGGLVYRGMVNADIEEYDTFSKLIQAVEREKPSDTVLNGYMYLVHNGPKTRIIEGKKLNNGDCLVINFPGIESSKKVADITKDDVGILDAMDSHVYDLINAISSDVGGLKTISADHADRISTLETRQCEISGKLDSVIEHVDNLNTSYELEGVNELSIITKVSQDKGQISIESRKLISSDVTGLKDFVENEISLSVKNMKSSIGEEGQFVVSVSQEDGKLVNPVYSKITDAFIDDDAISQNKVNNLTVDLFNISSELSTIERRRRGDVSLMGDFVWPETVSPAVDLSNFLKVATESSFDKILRKGFLYRFPVDQSLKRNGIEKSFVANDYVLIRNDVVLSDATFESFDYIKDYDGDIESLNDRIDNLNQEKISAEHGYIIDSIWENSGIVSASTRRLVSSDVENLEEFVKSSIEAERSVTHANYASLSGNNVISNYNEFTGPVKMDSLSVAFDRVYDTLDKYLSSDLPSLENPKILGMGQRINDIIILSELPIDRIEDFNSAIVNDLVIRTKQIYVQAYSETAPEITKFSQMTDILNGVLGVLKVKGTGLTLQSRLNLLHKNIELVSKYVDTLNVDLANLCVHVNLSCQEIKDDISEISSNLNTLSSDYKGLKDSTFHKFDDATHISSYGLIITDADHPEDTKPHDRYVMTFLSGTLVLEKI